MNFFGMEPKVKDFLNLLETIAPVRLAEPWDNPGLQVGSFSQEIRKVFTSLDPTLNALISAAEANAQLLFTHHPLIFKSMSRLDINSFPGDVVAEALKRGVSIVAAHTNLDAAKGGINDILADLMGLRSVEVLQNADEMDGVGLGRIGYLSGPTKLSSVARNVKKILGIRDIKVVGHRDALIHRLAVVGGSGGTLLSLAYEKGADLLLTGDVDHHVALEAKSLGMALLDGGHFHTEKTAFTVFVRNLKKILEAKDWEITFEIDENETDPLWIDVPLK